VDLGFKIKSAVISRGVQFQARNAGRGWGALGQTRPNTGNKQEVPDAARAGVQPNGLRGIGGRRIHKEQRYSAREGPPNFVRAYAWRPVGMTPFFNKLLKNEKRRQNGDVSLTLVSKQLRKTNPTAQS
jgi:hypothetical protein